MYTCIHVYICVNIYIYIYTYIKSERRGPQATSTGRWASGRRLAPASRSARCEYDCYCYYCCNV